MDQTTNTAPKPIANATAPEPVPALPAPDVQPADAQIDLAQVKSMLDLPATASDLELITVLVNLVANLQEKYEGLLADAVAMEDHLTNRDLADYAHVIDESAIPFWKEQILVNRTAALEALNGLSQRLTPAPEEAPSAEQPQETRVIPLRNRLAAIDRTVEKVATASAPDAERDPVAYRIRNRAHQIAKDERVPFIIAFNRAERELNQENQS